jgi:hypothetical protein
MKRVLTAFSQHPSELGVAVPPFEQTSSRFLESAGLMLPPFQNKNFCSVFCIPASSIGNDLYTGACGTGVPPRYRALSSGSPSITRLAT